MKQRWNLILGAFFLAWGTANTVFLISRYGVDQGMYTWFCNLALFGTSLALFLKNKSLVISFLAPLLLTQSFWILENILRLITGKEYFGIVEFLYQPGLGMPEFILGHYHYFLIPVLFFCLLVFENRRNDSARIIFSVGAILFSLSYFVFPAEQNINCSHMPCFPDLEHWKGKTYSILFPVIMLALSLITARVLYSLFAHRTLSGTKLRTAWISLTVIICIASGLVYGDIRVKKTIPRFSCKGPSENEEVAIRCRYTTEYMQDWMVLVYEMKNKTPNVRECASFIEFEGKKELFQDNLFLEPGKPTNISILIHYPIRDTEIQLSATCH